MNNLRIIINRLFAAAAVLSVALMAVSAAGARAEDQEGGAPGDWLTRYSSARTLGMGGAFVAAADEPVGALWNPACMSRVYQNSFQMETARLFESTSINTISFSTPERDMLPGFGANLLSLSSGEFERTNEFNDVMGEFKEGDIAFLLTASKGLSRQLSFGASVKVVRQSVDEFTGTGFGADAGVLYDPVPSLSLGVSILNIGGPTIKLRDTSEKFPNEVRGGAALRLFSGKGIISSEVAYHSWYGVRLHGGAEFWAHPVMALRIGYNDTYLAGGLSFRLPNGLQLDYAASDHFLDVTHRIGISYSFGGYFASSRANPEVFSPIGARSVTKIHMKSRTRAEASAWALKIMDKSDIVVRRFSGKGQPPAHVMWDGKDKTGLPLPDGIYRYQLTVTDAEGRVFEGPEKEIEILTSGPRGNIPMIISE